jgi:glutamyl-tRNA synthetase
MQHRVTVEVEGRETEDYTVETKPLHKKNADIGEKKLVYASKLIMEQEDALSFGDNEEVSWKISHAST